MSDFPSFCIIKIISISFNFSCCSYICACNSKFVGDSWHRYKCKGSVHTRNVTVGSDLFVLTPISRISIPNKITCANKYTMTLYTHTCQWFPQHFYMEWHFCTYTSLQWYLCTYTWRGVSTTNLFHSNCGHIQILDTMTLLYLHLMMGLYHLATIFIIYTNIATHKTPFFHPVCQGFPPHFSYRVTLFTCTSPQ